MFRCDGGKEFACEEVCRVLINRGITLLLFAPYASEENRVAERENRTVVELTWSLLSVSRLTKLMWAQACESAVYVLNHTGKTPVIVKSPMEMWNGHAMKNLYHTRAFGTECHVYILKQFQNIFDKIVFGRMVGYLNDKGRYQVYVYSLKNIVHSHVVYFKPERVCTNSVAETGLENAGVVDVVMEKRLEDDTLSESSQLEQTLEAETEEEFSRNKGRPIHAVKWPMWKTSRDYIIPSARTAVTGGRNPTSHWEALNSAQKEEWVLAMKDEMDALGGK